MRRHVVSPGLRAGRTAYTGLPVALVGAIALSAVPEAAHAAEAHYTVAPGDTVTAIAGRHGLRTADVLARNGLGWSSILQPGQRLTLSGTPAATPAAAPAAAPAPPPLPAGYTIQPGDTISAIARSHGFTVDAVLAENGLDRSSIIYPGQTIALPAMVRAAATAPVIDGLDAEQVANAQLIVRVGRELGVPDRGIAVALGTAMVESWLRNLDWGDRDSLGLFQQRPSAGWGSPSDVTDPTRSTRAFFGGTGDPNGTRTRGLLDIPGWEAMSFTDAAQAVQVSAYPERYGPWEAPAALWLAALG